MRDAARDLPCFVCPGRGSHYQASDAADPARDSLFPGVRPVEFESPTRQASRLKRSFHAIVCRSVDNLIDLNFLEYHIKESAAILIMLGSSSYFGSRNCLREARSAQDLNKDLCLVHESDPAKSGAPLSQLKDLCPADLRGFVFDGREVLKWIRLRDFQVKGLRH